MDKLVLKGVFQEFDRLNRNPPSYRTRGFWPKNFTRIRKIKKIIQEPDKKRPFGNYGGGYWEPGINLIRMNKIRRIYETRKIR